jgi:hypothetical protein
MTTTIDLFVNHITDPIVGLKVQTPTQCKCRCNIARIVKGEWLNVPFCCEGCGIERGRLSYATVTFVRRAVEIWGRPTSPIELKHGNYIATSSQPSGADAETQSIAPAGPKEPNDYERRDAKCPDNHD